MRQISPVKARGKRSFLSESTAENQAIKLDRSERNLAMSAKTGGGKKMVVNSGDGLNCKRIGDKAGTCHDR